jgi:carboxylesterase type B
MFHKAIMQSGCVFNPWAFNENHKKAAFKLAEHMGCQKDDPKEIVQYLLNVPATDLVKFSTLKLKFEVCIINNIFSNYKNVVMKKFQLLLLIFDL